MWRCGDLLVTRRVCVKYIVIISKAIVVSDQSLHDLDNINSKNKERPVVSVPNEIDTAKKHNSSIRVMLRRGSSYILDFCQTENTRSWFECLLNQFEDDSVSQSKIQTVNWLNARTIEGCQENVSSRLRESLQHERCSGKINHYDQRSCNKCLSLLQMMSVWQSRPGTCGFPPHRAPGPHTWTPHLCSDSTCRRADVLMISRVLWNAYLLKSLWFATLVKDLIATQMWLKCDVADVLLLTALRVATLYRPTWPFSELDVVMLQLQRGHKCRLGHVRSQDSTTGSNSEQVSVSNRLRGFLLSHLCSWTCLGLRPHEVASTATAAETHVSTSRTASVQSMNPLQVVGAARSSHQVRVLWEAPEFGVVVSISLSSTEWADDQNRWRVDQVFQGLDQDTVEIAMAQLHLLQSTSHGIIRYVSCRRTHSINNNRRRLFEKFDIEKKTGEDQTHQRGSPSLNISQRVRKKKTREDQTHHRRSPSPGSPHRRQQKNERRPNAPP